MYLLTGHIPKGGRMSVSQTKWVERTFECINPIGVFPAILERFRGTPARLEEGVRGLPHRILISKPGGAWSIQEHAGHLLDLEDLGELRLREFLGRVPVLSPADMGNRKTYEADHNARSIDGILSDFRKARLGLTARLEALNETEAAISSLHPRLNKQMRVIDWVFFMAEHDDHHLARISAMIRAGSG